LKFDTLLAQYLYQHKKLNLPGIGTFEADASYGPQEEGDKIKSPEGISYRNVRVLQPDDDLIDFIKTHTGKMKPLALSDLEDYVALGKQFLNIGKPFYIEGIGTLKLTKEGKYEFTPGAYVTTKLEDPNFEKTENRTAGEYREDRIRYEQNNASIKKTLLVVAVLATLALVGWAGYYLYTMNANTATPVDIPEENTAAAASQDSLDKARIQDSVNAATAAVDTTSGNYKFIVERTTKARAMRRYNDLISFGNKIQYETTDSVNYRLFYSLPATPADTTRIRDSINRWYYGNNKKIRVRVEK
jgi:hypothetical protein